MKHKCRLVKKVSWYFNRQLKSVITAVEHKYKLLITSTVKLNRA